MSIQMLNILFLNLCIIYAWDVWIYTISMPTPTITIIQYVFAEHPIPEFANRHCHHPTTLATITACTLLRMACAIPWNGWCLPIQPQEH